jgi:RNA polymerase Rpb1, domain 6
MPHRTLHTHLITHHSTPILYLITSILSFISSTVSHLTTSHHSVITPHLPHLVSSHLVSSHPLSCITPHPHDHRVIMGCRGSGSESDPFTYLPVNIDRLIWNAQRQFRIKMQEPTSLDPRVRNMILNMHTMTLTVLCHVLALVLVFEFLQEEGKSLFHSSFLCIYSHQISVPCTSPCYPILVIMTYSSNASFLRHNDQFNSLVLNMYVHYV